MIVFISHLKDIRYIEKLEELIKMCTEVPVYTRCCFCLPLRHGLLTWGYLKIITGIIGMIMSITSLVRLVQMINLYDGYQVTPVIINFTIAIFLALVQIALNILFVVGAHKKNIKLLRVYYIYSMVALGINCVVLAISMYNVVPHLDRQMFESYHGWLLVSNYVIGFVDIVLQIYILLILRSEIMKLNDKRRVQYNAPRAEITMEYKGRPEEEEKFVIRDAGQVRNENEGRTHY